MRRPRVPIGLLISTEGPYSTVSRSMLRGALLAISEVNDGASSVELVPQIANPAGDLARYAGCAEALLSSGIRHVVGCYTSSSRKEIIPLFEKFDALLWYPSHYEGFENSANVIYTGAVANQHLLPLLEFLLSRVGSTAFCVGSNYIWAWENTRILRETIRPAGGVVLAERYFPVGSEDFGQVIDAIIKARPSFVFNTLIGTSSYQFLRAFRARCTALGIDQAGALPVASCTLSEPELDAIGPDAMDGHVTASVYFSSIASPQNEAFTAAYRTRFPDHPRVGADAEASYVAVRLLAGALAEAGRVDAAAVRRAVVARPLQAPQGLVAIDPATMHASLTPRIGCSERDGGFRILCAADRPVAADPYLTHSSSRFGEVKLRPMLRLAS